MNNEKSYKEFTDGLELREEVSNLTSYIMDNYEDKSKAKQLEAIDYAIAELNGLKELLNLNELNDGIMNDIKNV